MIAWGWLLLVGALSFIVGALFSLLIFVAVLSIIGEIKNDIKYYDPLG